MLDRKPPFYAGWMVEQSVPDAWSSFWQAVPEFLDHFHQTSPGSFSKQTQGFLQRFTGQPMSGCSITYQGLDYLNS